MESPYRRNSTGTSVKNKMKPVPLATKTLIGSAGRKPSVDKGPASNAPTSKVAHVRRVSADRTKPSSQPLVKKYNKKAPVKKVSPRGDMDKKKVVDKIKGKEKTVDDPEEVAEKEKSAENEREKAAEKVAGKEREKDVAECIEVRQLSDEEKAQAFQAFCKFDFDHSGTIDEGELHALLNHLYRNVSLPEANLIYQQVDSNRSGKITFDEFLVAVVNFNWNLNLLCQEDNKSNEKLVFDWEIPYTELNLFSKLGEGSFGEVYLARWRGCVVAVKEIKKSISVKIEDMDDFRSEISLMSKLRHPNVVLFMGASTEGENLAIVTEYVSGGSLFELLHEQNRTLTTREIVSIAHQVALGVNYLHLGTPKIIHRDLKPMNILLDGRSNKQIKLIDFGLSCVKEHNEELTERVGTPIWMPPEILRGEPYDEKADIYSFALCIWECLTRKIPYVNLSFSELMYQVGVQGDRPSIPKSCPKKLATLIKRCWAGDPKLRPAFSEILTELESMLEEPGAGGSFFKRMLP